MTPTFWEYNFVFNSNNSSYLQLFFTMTNRTHMSVSIFFSFMTSGTCLLSLSPPTDSGRVAQRIEDPSMRFGGIPHWPLAALCALPLPLSLSRCACGAPWRRGGRQGMAAWGDGPAGCAPQTGCLPTYIKPLGSFAAARREPPATAAPSLYPL